MNNIGDIYDCTFTFGDSLIFPDTIPSKYFFIKDESYKLFEIDTLGQYVFTYNGKDSKGIVRDIVSNISIDEMTFKNYFKINPFKKSLELLKKSLNSEEGKKHLREYADKILKEKEYVLNYHNELSLLSDEQFETLLKKEFALHTEEYKDECYAKSCEPSEMEDLSNIYDVMLEYGEDVEIIGDGMFVSETKLYKGFVIQVYQGQGCFYRVYKNGECIFQL